MTDYKELWFLRHPEVDKAGNFDLTVRGKEHAHMLGWRMANSELLYPAIVLQTESPRTKTAAYTLAHSIEQHNPQARKIEHGFYSLPEVSPETGFAKLLQITRGLGNFPDKPQEEMPNTAIFVIHARHMEALTLFSILMSSPLAIKLSKEIDPPESGFAGMIVELSHNFPAKLTYSEIWRMRFSIAHWRDLRVGTGAIVSHETLETIEPAYEAWRDSLKLRTATTFSTTPHPP